jgi:carbamoyltransferase
MKSIFAAGVASHDHGWYNGKEHHCMERFTRIKGNKVKLHEPIYIDLEKVYNMEYDLLPIKDRKIDTQSLFFEQDVIPHINNYDIVALTLTGAFNKEHELLLEHSNGIKNLEPKKLFDHYYKDNIFYSDHHQSHGIYAYLQSGFEECDILVLDAGADRYTGLWIDKDKNIHNLTLDTNLGRTWLAATSGCNWFCEQHTGKVMGLAAYGKTHDGLYTLLSQFIMDGNQDNLNKHEKMLFEYRDKHNISKEDIAATMQELNNDIILELIEDYKTSDNICVSGGVAYNGYMNELLTKYYHNVFVPPAVGDEGQSIGVYMHADYVINNNTHIPSVYSGLEYVVE